MTIVIMTIMVVVMILTRNNDDDHNNKMQATVHNLYAMPCTHSSSFESWVESLHRWHYNQQAASSTHVEVQHSEDMSHVYVRESSVVQSVSLFCCFCDIVFCCGCRISEQR